MENTNQREKLIEDAAKAICGFEESPENWRSWVAHAGAALAVFEGAYTPTDDEWEALDSFRGWTPLEVKNAPYQAARVISTLIYKLERRTVQGEFDDLHTALYRAEEVIEKVRAEADAYGRQPDVMEPCGAVAQSLRFILTEYDKKEGEPPCRYCGRPMPEHPGGVYCPAGPVQGEPSDVAVSAAGEVLYGISWGTDLADPDLVRAALRAAAETV